MTPRAMTLIELLLALTLLSGLTAVGVTWTVTLSRTAVESDAAAAWTAAAQSALDRVADDLLARDAPAARSQPRVTVAADRLAVLTRDAGPARAAFALDGRRLYRSTAPPDDPRAEDRRLLLDRVGAFDLRVDPPIEAATQNAPAHTLTLVITSDDGTSVQRRFRLTREDVR